MKFNMDINIDVHDEHRIKSIMHERVSGNNEVQILQQFMMAFTRILKQLHEQELKDKEVIDDDIPF